MQIYWDNFPFPAQRRETVITMCAVYVGGAAFALYFLYDLNSVLWNNRLLHGSFFLGCLLLLAATAADLWSGWPGARLLSPLRLLCLLAAAVCLGLLIYTLFFALPFEETYQEQERRGRTVCATGMYALCRHPGILWFFFLYLLLGLAFAPSPLLSHGLFYSLCNLLYAAFQDLWTFPRTFRDYRQYQKKTPFLLPTPASIRRAVETGRVARRSL